MTVSTGSTTATDPTPTDSAAAESTHDRTAAEIEARYRPAPLLTLAVARGCELADTVGG